MNFVDLNFTAEFIGERQALPPFLGPTLRGAFGYLLKRTVCQVAHGQCDRCLLKNVCPYTVIFEGIPPEGRPVMRKYPRVPQPFVLRSSWGDRADEDRRFSWGVRLFGIATRYWPYVIHVFRLATEAGIGRQRVRSKIVEVSDGVGAPAFWTGDESEWRDPLVQTISSVPAQLPERCTLRWQFYTPVQIVRDGKAVGTRLDGLDLLLAGRRRWGVMNAFYGTPLEAKDDPDVRFDRSDFVTHFNGLRHWNISRYSGRQERKVELHGVVGEIVVEGPWGLAGDWLQAIPKLHIGKSVSFGLGAVEWSVVAKVEQPVIADTEIEKIESPSHDIDLATL